MRRASLSGERLNELISGQREAARGNEDANVCAYLRLFMCDIRESRIKHEPDAKVPMVDTLIGTGGGKGCCGVSR